MNILKYTINCVFLFAFLTLRFYSFYQSHPPYHDGQEVSLTVTLQQEPAFSYSGQKFSIKTPTNQLISVTAVSSPRFHYGEIVSMQGKLKAYTFSDGKTILALYHPQTSLVKEADNPVAMAANYVRSASSALYKSALPQ